MSSIGDRPPVERGQGLPGTEEQATRARSPQTKLGRLWNSIKSACQRVKGSFSRAIGRSFVGRAAHSFSQTRIGRGCIRVITGVRRIPTIFSRAIRGSQRASGQENPGQPLSSPARTETPVSLEEVISAANKKNLPGDERARNMTLKFADLISQKSGMSTDQAQSLSETFAELASKWSNADAGGDLGAGFEHSEKGDMFVKLYEKIEAAKSAEEVEALMTKFADELSSMNAFSDWTEGTFGGFPSEKSAHYEKLLVLPKSREPVDRGASASIEDGDLGLEVDRFRE